MGVGISIAALIIGSLAFIASCASLVYMIGVSKSTHKIQYMPLDPTLNETGEGKDPLTDAIEKEYQRFTDDQL